MFSRSFLRTFLLGGAIHLNSGENVVVVTSGSYLNTDYSVKTYFYFTNENRWEEQTTAPLPGTTVLFVDSLTTTKT